MVQTLFIDQHQNLNDLQKLSDLKKRFTYAAEEAQYIVDLFLSCVHIRNTTEDFPTSGDLKRSLHLDYFRRSFKSVVGQFLSCVHVRNHGHSLTCEYCNPSLNLYDVRKSLKSVKVEFMSMNIDSKKILGSSPRPQTTNQSAAAATQGSISRGSKKFLDEIFVGIDRDAELIRDKLVEDQKKLDVVSIVGMGGIGKTTLAAKVFNDGYVKHHFHLRVWVTVSQTYNKRAMLTQILESICTQLDLEKATDSALREMVHKHLFGQRYLIVVDDIWHIETWDNLKSFFPHDNNGSRILLTSRLTEVAKHANSDGLIHHLGCLSKEEGWELLRQKVFQGNECPEWSIKPGMQIVKGCHGLPLAVVVMAGVLAKEAWSENFWVNIAYRTSLYIVGDENGCIETLALSYNYLPLHLKECFLYLGGFPEDYLFRVRNLIWLWVAEGFIQQDGSRSLEDIAEGYLMDLIDRNLVIVVERMDSNGAVKACKVHDLVRELCLLKGREEQFILQTETPLSYHRYDINDVVAPPSKPLRMFINKDVNVAQHSFPSAQNIRAILCSLDFTYSWNNFAIFSCSFVLLRVLDLQKYGIDDLPKDMKLLVHLRYLAIYPIKGLPSWICNLWNLQTLIYITKQSSIDLPSNISDLVNLRHLWGFSCYDYRKTSFYLPSIEKPMNLQTISGVQLGYGVDNFQKCFPYIKKLTTTAYIRKQNDFKSLTYLEKLKFTSFYGRVDHITFPTSLKTLTLVSCHIPWSDMSIIQLLPNLQALKLHNNAFEGCCWNTDEQEFPQLKFLRLELLDIKQWEVCSISFPCLRQLEIVNCYNLEEIPLEIGDIPTLELIVIKKCRHSVGESVRRIQQEQYDLGNYDLRIDIQEERHNLR